MDNALTRRIALANRESIKDMTHGDGKFTYLLTLFVGSILYGIGFHNLILRSGYMLTIYQYCWWFVFFFGITLGFITFLTWYLGFFRVLLTGKISSN
jgi:hypothetical protein